MEWMIATEVVTVLGFSQALIGLVLLIYSRIPRVIKFTRKFNEGTIEKNAFVTISRYNIEQDKNHIYVGSNIRDLNWEAVKITCVEIVKNVLNDKLKQYNHQRENDGLIEKRFVTKHELERGEGYLVTIINSNKQANIASNIKGAKSERAFLMTMRNYIHNKYSDWRLWKTHRDFFYLFTMINGLLAFGLFGIFRSQLRLEISSLFAVWQLESIILIIMITLLTMNVVLLGYKVLFMVPSSFSNFYENEIST